MDLFRQKCKEYNLKTTPQRVVIYNEIRNSKEHPCTDNMFKKVRRIFPDISFDTVNRTLLTFTEIGILNVVEGHGGPKRFDPDLNNHHHFWCIRCNNIIDLYNKSYDNMKIVKGVQKGFTVLRKKVILEGICNKCNRRD